MFGKRGKTPIRRYFDEVVFAGPDPDQYWGIDKNPAERLKFEQTLDLCGPGPFEHALEIGCALGAFTELLAPRCRSLLAVDISERAVEVARRRVVAYDGVRCEARDLTAEFPRGPFDLVVGSDTLYYWTRAQIVQTLSNIEHALVPGGSFIVLHYVPRVKHSPELDGNGVHDLLAQHCRLGLVDSKQMEFGEGRPYRVDVFRKPESLGAQPSNP